jgi:hypothetical protein
MLREQPDGNVYVTLAVPVDKPVMIAWPVERPVVSMEMFDEPVLHDPPVLPVPRIRVSVPPTHMYGLPVIGSKACTVTVADAMQPVPGAVI